MLNLKIFQDKRLYLNIALFNPLPFIWYLKLLCRLRLIIHNITKRERRNDEFIIICIRLREAVLHNGYIYLWADGTTFALISKHLNAWTSLHSTEVHMGKWALWCLTNNVSVNQTECSRLMPLFCQLSPASSLSSHKSGQQQQQGGEGRWPYSLQSGTNIVFNQPSLLGQTQT